MMKIYAIEIIFMILRALSELPANWPGRFSQKGRTRFKRCEKCKKKITLEKRCMLVMLKIRVCITSIGDVKIMDLLFPKGVIQISLACSGNVNCLKNKVQIYIYIYIYNRKLTENASLNFSCSQTSEKKSIEILKNRIQILIDFYMLT